MDRTQLERIARRDVDEELRQARALLARVPQERLDWRPEPVSSSLVELTEALREMIRPTELPLTEAALARLIHERGRLTVYLRLLEVPLPPIYGPTADEEPSPHS